MPGEEWIHVVPENDLIEHSVEGPSCACDPEIDPEHMLVIHSAMDRRECFEPDSWVGEE